MVEVNEYTVNSNTYCITQRMETYILCMDDDDYIEVPCKNIDGTISIAKIKISILKEPIKTATLAQMSNYSKNYLKAYLEENERLKEE